MRIQRYVADRNWASMETDILCSILVRIHYVDLLRVKSTCRGWHEAVVQLGSFSGSSFPILPWLIYTPSEAEQVTEGEKTGRFVNMEYNESYPFNDLAAKKMNDGCSCHCIGSSHDWLACLDKQARPYLLNPFTSRIIDLPHLDLALGVRQVWGTGNQCRIDMVEQHGRTRTVFRANIVTKAVLSSSPSLGGDYCLVIVYGINLQLAFCKDGDTSWTKLDSDPVHNYCDILFHENQLYGIYREYSLLGSFHRIRVWDMNQDGFLLVKNIEIVLEELKTRPQITGFMFYLMATYLVKSQGSLLVVTRLDVNPSLGNKKLHLTPTTSRFQVFKLDADQKILTGVTSLSGFSLFLGRNRSISVDVRNCKMLKQDVIYLNSDVGQYPSMFSLKDNSFVWLYGYERGKRESVPTWIVPLVLNDSTERRR